MPLHVLIAGGGVAGLEALIALRSHAGDRVAITLLTPESTYSVRALSVEDPFARPTPPAYALAAICAAQDAVLVHGELGTVDTETQVAHTVAGARLTYDALIVAVGASAHAPFSSGITFDGTDAAEAVHGLVQDLEEGYAHRLAFVVPDGITWPLPLYELALLSAERAGGMGAAGGSAPHLTLITPEPRPLAAFGEEASRIVEGLLRDAGVTVVTETRVADVVDGTVLAADGAVLAAAQRIVTIPRLAGRPVTGLPVDDAGFLPVDDGCAVRGAPLVWGAGDGTSIPFKQGAVAAQAADVAARAIAAAAGAPVETRVLQARLQARLLTGRGTTPLGEPWAAGGKVAAPFLGSHLAELDARERAEVAL